MNDGLTIGEIRDIVREQRERNRARSRENAKFQREQTRLNGGRRVDARSMARKAPKRYGVFAERAYSCNTHYKTGIQHFSV